MKLNLLAACSAAALVLSVGIAAAESIEFGDFDKNADKNLSMEEFGAGLDQTKVYAMYDANGDGNIDEAELKAGTDLRFKADMDAKKFDQDRYGDWSKWDINGDGKVDRNEFNGRLYTYYNTDADPNAMNEAEFGAGVNVFTVN